MTLFERKTTTQSLASGWEAVMHRVDGSATKAWGVTEDDALENLGHAITDGE